MDGVHHIAYEETTKKFQRAGGNCRAMPADAERAVAWRAQCVMVSTKSWQSMGTAMLHLPLLELARTAGA